MAADSAPAGRPEAPSGFEEGDLVCLRCHRSPLRRTVVWLVAESKAVHTATPTGATKKAAIRQVCGGLVVPVSEAWRANVAPGKVALCVGPQSLQLHRVRLGESVDLAAGTWSGTALCGARLPLGRYWYVVKTDEAQAGDVCRKCDEAHAEAKR